MNAISAIMGLEGTVASAAGALAGGIAELKDPKLAKKLEKAAKEEDMSKLARAINKAKLKAQKENKRFGEVSIRKIMERSNARKGGKK